MEKMVSLERARELISKEVSILPSESVAVTRTQNRVLTQDAKAFVSLPSARISFCDGYVLKAKDVVPGKRFKLGNPIFAGNPRTEPLSPGESAWIATGAVIPEEADAVVPEENVKKFEDEIEVLEKVEPGLNIREDTEEFKKDQVLLTKGTLIKSREIALLIAGGYFEVEVVRKPRLCVIAVGDELRHPGTVARPGEVYPSAGWLVALLSEELGCELVRMLLVEDTPEALQEAIPEPAEADLVITVGGTGFGRKDIIIETLEALKAQIIFQGVKMRPGHSLIFSRQAEQIIFSLPGRISATEISFNFLVQYAILQMTGKQMVSPVIIQARTKTHLEASKNLQHILRGKLESKEGELWVNPLRKKSAHLEMIEADGYIILEENRKPTAPGELVNFMVHWDRLSAFFPKA